jgi:hypothetical protein
MMDWGNAAGQAVRPLRITGVSITTMTELCLHLGAHKTATTWLQTRLAEGRTQLQQIGVDYAPLGRIRPRISTPFSRWLGERGVAGRQSLRNEFAAFVRGEHARFIASDENLIGTCNGIARSGRLYGALRWRMRGLREILPSEPVCVVLSIRHYAGFFASAYAESLRHDDFVAFDNFRAALKLDDGLWVRVVEDLVEVFGAQRVRIMQFERLKERSHAMVEILCGRAVEPGLLPDPGPVREGLSACAVDALATIADLSSGAVARSAVPVVAERYSRAAGFAAFAPWSEAEEARFDDLYRSHVSTIRDRWPQMFI